MKHIIKLFIASSSIKSAQERASLRDFIRFLNDTSATRGIHFQLIPCEDLSNAVEKDRKQAEYDLAIRESPDFYIIFGKSSDRADDAIHTIVEPGTAPNPFKKSGSPKIHAYFLHLPEGESASGVVRDFISRLDQAIGHYDSALGSVDTITLKKLLDLACGQVVGGKVHRAEEVFEAEKDEIQKYILSKQALINAYKAEGNTAETAQKILAVYEDITSLAEKHHTMPDVLYDYASFLYNQHQYQNSLVAAQRLERWYASEPYTNVYKQAKLDYLMGSIYFAQGNFMAAEKLLREALKIYRDLAVKNPDAYLPDLARSCNNLASLLNNIGSLKEASELYQESVKIYRNLAEKKSDAYLPNLATSCSNLACLFDDIGSLKKAEELYREALKLYHGLVAKSPNTYLPAVAAICSSLAYLLYNDGSFDETKELYQEALKIYRDLAVKKPDVYLPAAALTCKNLASLLHHIGSLKEAAELYREALKIYRDLAVKDPDTYLPGLALICFKLADILYDVNSFKEAEKLYREALKIYRDLAVKNPDDYLPDLALNCNDLAFLLEHIGSLKEAEELYREALKIRRDLAAKDPSYLSAVANVGSNLANTLRKTRSFEEAEELYREALKIRWKLAEKNPKVHLPRLQRVCDGLTALLEETGRQEEANNLKREMAAFLQKQ